MKTYNALIVLILLVLSSCTIIPNKYVHYEGERLAKSDRVTLTSSFSSKMKYDVLSRFSNSIDQDDLVISKTMYLLEINGEPYHSNLFGPQEQFDNTYNIEIPSGETTILVKDSLTTFNTKKGHEYAIFKVLADGYTSYSHIHWKEYTLILDKTDNTLMAATTAGGVKYVK